MTAGGKKEMYMVVSTSGTEFLTAEEMSRRFTPDIPLSKEVINFYRRVGITEKVIQAPRFKELIGPMDGGEYVRYETLEFIRSYSSH